MKKVLIGLSGGVDSAVAAYLLKNEGYEVCGVTLRTRKGGGEDGNSFPEVDDARRVADALGIRHIAPDCSEEFTKRVVDPFVRSYLRGETPNPCIECNRWLKWEKILDAARDMGADYVATGHYAFVVRLNNGRYTVKKALHAAKDQTYMLYKLSQEQLAATLMPLGRYSKEDVRRIAKEAGIPVANKPDSQEICFVTDGRYTAFIEEYVKKKNAQTLAAASAHSDKNTDNNTAVNISGTEDGSPGSPCVQDSVSGSPCVQDSVSESSGMQEGLLKVPGPGSYVDEQGNILGRHKGITHYTIGQRKGLGIALGRHIYVKEIHADTDEVVLSDEPALFRNTVIVRDVNFQSIPGMAPGEQLRALAKIRYHHEAAPALLEMQKDNFLRIFFDKPVRAAAPGQSSVFYDENDCVIGGGIIM